MHSGFSCVSGYLNKYLVSIIIHYSLSHPACTGAQFYITPTPPFRSRWFLHYSRRDWYRHREYPSHLFQSEHCARDGIGHGQDNHCWREKYVKKLHCDFFSSSIDVIKEASKGLDSVGSSVGEQQDGKRFQDFSWLGDNLQLMYLGLFYSFFVVWWHALLIYLVSLFGIYCSCMLCSIMAPISHTGIICGVDLHLPFQCQWNELTHVQDANCFEAVLLSRIWIFLIHSRLLGMIDTMFMNEVQMWVSSLARLTSWTGNP